MILKIEKFIDRKDIADILCSALEGGSTYWAQIEEYVQPKHLWVWQKGESYAHVQYPLSEGGALIIRDTETEHGEDGPVYTLNLESIKRGLEAMAINAPAAFALFEDGGFDAETADIFLQFCLLGENVYG